MTAVKICGIREVEHALVAANAGADYLGLIFYPPSHRYLSPEAARDLVVAVRAARPAAPRFVGIFVDEPLAAVERIAATVGLDVVQLSGDESWDDCAALGLPVIRALRVEMGADRAAMTDRLRGGERLLTAGRVQLLLDTQHAGFYGGSGRTFDWAIAADLARDYPLLLAGGLTPENAGDAIRQVAPYGLDVSSGVETDKRKDPDKIRRFLAAVRSTDVSPATTP